jgi:hypothetical protein
MNQQLWVEPVGELILARLRGRCDEQILRECQHRVFELVKDTHQVKVLYDALELEDPTVDMALLQQKMDAEASEQLGPHSAAKSHFGAEHANRVSGTNCLWAIRRRRVPSLL